MFKALLPDVIFPWAAFLNLVIRIYRHLIPTATVLFVAAEAFLLFFLIKFFAALQIANVGSAGRATITHNTTTLSLLLVLTTVLSGLAAGLYRQTLGTSLGWILTAATATGLSLGLGMLVMAVFGGDVIEGQWELILPLPCTICFVITRRVATTASARGFFKRRAVLIGDGAKATEIEAFSNTASSSVRIVDRLCVGGTASLGGTLEVNWPANRLKADGIQEALIAVDDPRALPIELLLQWKLSGIAVTDYPTFWEREAGYISLDAFDPNWFVYGEGCRRGRLGRALKRALDIAVALLLLVATAPLLCAFALLVRLESPGPVLYRQQRTGRYGKPFMLLKFRSMRADAEKATPKWATQNDPRVTRIGRFMRSTRIDELPQLVNVILGHMSLIGPRPERPFFVEQLGKEIPYYNDRHFARPGLTGWAQINYPYGASTADARRKLEYDLYYLKNQSILLDLYIMLSTVRVILFREGSR
jgi:sugar transferase (PEP-CTERM system associated)